MTLYDLASGPIVLFQDTLLVKAATDPPGFKGGGIQTLPLEGRSIKEFAAIYKNTIHLWSCQMGLQAGFGQPKGRSE